MKSTCPICAAPAGTFFENEKHKFYLCPTCGAIFRDPKQLLKETEERSRYLNHISGVEDMGYYDFVSPLIDRVKGDFDKGSLGLDFGCGHTPVLSEHLKNEGYQMAIFDPIFFKDPKPLNKAYDFIVCCEVMEHFFQPLQEFQNLYNLLRPHGKLICKTHLYEPHLDFDAWYYKNDPTHVFLYQTQSLQWIGNACGFSDVKIDQRVITFSK